MNFSVVSARGADGPTPVAHSVVKPSTGLLGYDPNLCSHGPALIGNTNVLPDGRFINSYGYGPNGNEIPGHSDVDYLDFPYLNWEDGTQSYGLPTFWFQRDTWYPGVAKVWRVSSANPRIGTYHLRQVYDADVTYKQELFVGGLAVCVDRYKGNNWYPFQAAVITYGVTWTLSFWAMIDTPTNDHTFEVWWTYTDGFDLYTQSGWTTLSSALTGSYTQFSHSEQVPLASGIGFVPELLSLRIRNSFTGSSGTVTIDVDEFTLGIA